MRKLFIFFGIFFLLWEGMVAEAREHGALLIKEQEVRALGLHQDYGIQPKYNNKIPASWHTVDTVKWQGQKTSQPVQMKRWEVESRDEGGPLLFSDSPEYVKEDGILYSDVVQGECRLFYYHLNDMTKKKKLAVVLENQENSVAMVKIKRFALSKPSDDYLYVGKSAQEQFMSGASGESVLLLPKRRQLLQKEMDRVIVNPGELVNGIFDLECEGKVRISVIMYPAGKNPLDFISTAKVLPRDEIALRGTYQGMNRYITAPKAYDPARDGAVYIPLGDNHVDLYRKGIDATDGSEVVNYGNYGILYKINIPMEGEGEVRCLINPLGGIYAGAMTVGLPQEKSFMLPVPARERFFGHRTRGEDEEEVRLWLEGTDYINENSELADLGAYKALWQPVFEFSPPGASNLPVNLILLPKAQGEGLAYKWKKE